MDTVYALLNETGYSGQVSNESVMAIVDMLIQGKVPTEQDLMNLGIYTSVPQTTPMPGILDPSPGSTAGGAGMNPNPVPNPATNSGLGGTGTPVDLNTGFPPVPANPNTGFPTNTNTGFPPIPTNPNTGAGATSPQVNPGFPANTGGGSTPMFPPFPNPTDPMGGSNSVGGGGSTGAGLPTAPLNPFDPNAIGTKPFPTDLSGGAATVPSGNPFNPMGGGSNPFNPMGGGGNSMMGGGMGRMPTTGILDAQFRKPVQRKNNMMNNMMMMMMLNPEMMDMMMGGENPMLSMMMWQGMMQPKRPARTTPLIARNTMGSMGMSRPMGMAPSPGRQSSQSGLMDLINSLPPPGQSAQQGMSPMQGGAPAANTGSPGMQDFLGMLPGANTAPAPLAPAGVSPPLGGGASSGSAFDMNSFLGAGANTGSPTTGGGAGGLDALMNMINTAGPASGGAGPTAGDPFMAG